MKNGYLLITYYLLLITPESPTVPFSTRGYANGNAKGEHGGEDVTERIPRIRLHAQVPVCN
jgi:hypothetical protein